MPRISVIFPCRNEERRMNPQIFISWLRRYPDTRFLFVDDASSDGTAKLIRKIISDSPEHSASVLSLPENVGKAEAVRRGFLQLMEEAEGALLPPPDCIGFLDADLATPLEEIPALTQELLRGDCGIVIGSRVALFGRNIRRSPLRHYPGRIFATFASWTLDCVIYDTQCGAKFFRFSPDLRDLFDRPFLSTWCFDVELIARVKAKGSFCGQPFDRAIRELPLQTWVDQPGSKVRPLDFFRSLFELFRIRREVLKK